MTKASKFVGLGLAILAGLGIAFLVQRHPRVEKRPPQAIQEMTFPNGVTAITGNPETGEVCQEIQLCSEKGCREVSRLVHVGKDFRNATDEQKKAWLIEGAMKAAADGGLACGGASDDLFFPAAYADPPTCLDCGGGCTSASCPATLHASGPCTLGGVDCVITRICCGGTPCNCV